MQVETIFTYGSLMCPDIMSAVTGLALVGEPATLHGYRRYAVRGEHYPGAVAESGYSVQGVVYSGVSSDALRRLNAFEGECYQRTPITLFAADGSLVEAHSYLWREALRHQLAPWDWSFSHFLSKGKAEFMARYVGFCRA